MKRILRIYRKCREKSSCCFCIVEMWISYPQWLWITFGCSKIRPRSIFRRFYIVEMWISYPHPLWITSGHYNYVDVSIEIASRCGQIRRVIHTSCGQLCGFIFIDSVDNVDSVDKLSTIFVDNSDHYFIWGGDFEGYVEMWISYPQTMLISDRCIHIIFTRRSHVIHSLWIVWITYPQFLLISEIHQYFILPNVDNSGSG